MSPEALTDAKVSDERLEELIEEAEGDLALYAMAGIQFDPTRERFLDRLKAFTELREHRERDRRRAGITHSDECWQWHGECAAARVREARAEIERLHAAGEQSRSTLKWWVDQSHEKNKELLKLDARIAELERGVDLLRDHIEEPGRSDDHGNVLRAADQRLSALERDLRVTPPSLSEKIEALTARGEVHIIYDSDWRDYRVRVIPAIAANYREWTGDTLEQAVDAAIAALMGGE